MLTDKAVKGYDPNTKVNPPLRSEKDRQALCEGLKNNLIDVIATDHAPHTFEDKLGEFNQAANGISGLETALTLIYDKLISPDIISWAQLVKLMVYNPAQILQLSVEGIQEQATADLTVFDPERKWRVQPQKLKSKGKNTPFAGQQFKGKVLMTMIKGKIIYDDRGQQNEINY